MRLLTSSDAKTSKGEPLGYLTGILYMVPHLGSGLGNLCPSASAGCVTACLYTAGRGIMKPVAAGRLRKTRLFFAGSAAFVDMLASDICKLVKRAERRGLTPCIRLNGTSDVPWERMRGSDGLTLMERFPSVQFYDYTKRANRDPLWSNYHLTFSRSETNEPQALRELERGRNVAIVFSTRRGQPLPETWNGFRVVDGDAHDLRFLDPRESRGIVIGLRAKGRAKRDASGFIVEAA